MFQIGALIVFCGLLALPLPMDLVLIPTDLAGELTGALCDGLLSGGVLDTVKNLPLLDILKTDGDTSGGLIGKLLQQVINPVKNLTGIEITTPKLLELGLVQSEDDHHLYLNILLSFVAPREVKLRLLKMSVELNGTLELLPEKDEDGVHLVIGDCFHPAAKLKIILLSGSENVFIQHLINRLTNTLTKTITKLVLDEVCSMVNGLLSQLDVSLVHDIVNKLIPEKNFIVNI